MYVEISGGRGPVDDLLFKNNRVKDIKIKDGFVDIKWENIYHNGSTQQRTLFNCNIVRRIDIEGESSD